jgi:hypothetical protein
MRWRRMAVASFPVIASAVASASLAAQIYPPPLGPAHDPVSVAAPLEPARRSRLTPGQRRFFDAGQEEFEEPEAVPDGWPSLQPRLVWRLSRPARGWGKSGDQSPDRGGDRS